MDESGNYSFTGVENAKYYLLYFCAPDATGDNDSYIYTSGPIDATESNTYSGKCSDEFDYAFGSYLAKVYAFPDLTDKEHSMSKGATAEYSCSGNQSAPELNYYWNTFDGTMGIQVANLDVYEFEAYPDKVDVTFTNTENSADVVTLTMENVTPDNNQLDTDALTAGATYDVTAVSTSNSEYVLNPTSDTTKVAEGLHLGESSVMTAGYSYSDGFANNIFNWPRVCESFDLENGGVARRCSGDERRHIRLCRNTGFLRRWQLYLRPCCRNLDTQRKIGTESRRHLYRRTGRLGPCQLQ